jgi:hypothetical protein
MTKDTRAKPSAGALRAARAISGYRSLDYIAEIIDRETGMAELLEAAKHADEWFKWFFDGQSANRPTKTWDELKQAIAKCERSE